MRDYMSLSDADLVQLHGEVIGQPARSSDSPSASSPLEQEVNRRANELCASLDSKTAVYCRLENWSLRISPDPGNPDATVIVGCVYGHEEFPDGTPIVTSPLEIILRTESEDLAVTRNSLYRLSTLDPDYLKSLLEGNVL